jgi:hypothetical protein
VPVNPNDLTKGKLQALQVSSNITGQPITFQPIDAIHPQGNAFSPDQQALHTYGNSFDTKWVTIHNTATDASGAAFDASALAKAAGATPFKRPKNGQFRPGSNFREFFFDETGDTNALSTANADFGGWAACSSSPKTAQPPTLASCPAAALPGRGLRPIGDAELCLLRYAWFPERRRQRDHWPPRVRWRRRYRRHSRRQGATAVHGRLASVLNPAAR